METCFVIQPFDKGKFDSRYNDTYKPAILAAGLRPYRVDKDPSVTIPMEQIEAGIKSSKICFAEITLDNPNVWYELGFAFACGKDVVIITEERDKFPFDIQHRHVIIYNTTSKGDFIKLESDITDKLIGLLGKQESDRNIIESPLKESEGLLKHEVTMMFLIMENQITDEEVVSIYTLTSGMEKAGYNKMATNVSLRLLKQKGFIETSKEYSSYSQEEYPACKLTKLGEEWVLNNQHKIELQFTPKAIVEEQSDDSLPF